MKTIKEWDKKSPINGVDADRVLSLNPSFKDTVVFLILNNGSVERIENANTIRANTGYTGTDEEVMSKYLDVLENPEKGMTRKELIDAMKDYINKFVDQQILSGFVWNNMPVWLSAENQNNYKAAYDLAFQANMLQMDFTPVKFKFGTDEEVVYHTFESFEELADFYVKAVQYVQICLENGWADKDGYANDTDEQLREKYKEMQL